MPLISGTIPSFIGGVSQQDASVRQAAQIDSALNCDMSPSDGAGKRGPAQFIAGLGSDIPPDAFFHTIQRDSFEKYLVVVYGRKIRVFNHTDGHEYQVVLDQDALPYLDTTHGQAQTLRACSFEDYTFIANRDVKVALTDEVTPGVIIGSYQTFEDLPKNGSPNFGHIEAWQYTGKYNALDGGEYEQVPTRGTATYHITGSSESKFDDFYVRPAGAGVYEEVPAPGSLNELDPATMPHGLKRIPDSTNPDGLYFSYGPLDWGKRLAGDEDSAPPPSIVGSRIGDVFFHRGRFGIIADEHILLSEEGFYFNFWRTTVTTLLDSERLDLSPPIEGVAQLTHALSYQKALLLFSSGKRTVFEMTGSPILTPKTVQINPVTDYEVSPYIKPVACGTSIFFINHSSVRPWTNVREYFVSDEQVAPDAPEISSHVPRYIPGNTRCLAAIPDRDMLAISHASPTGPQVYVYQYRWQGNTKEQSAWHPWQLAGVGEVLFMDSIASDLYIVAVAPGGGAELLKVDLTSASRTTEVTDQYQIHLDRLTVVTPNYQALGNYTDIDLPFVADSMDAIAVVKSAEWDHPGALLDLQQASLVNGGDTVRLQGNVGTGKVAVGFKYTQSITPSQQFLRKDKLSVLIGRLQLRRMTVRFNSAGYFRCVVIPRGRGKSVNPVATGRLSTYTGRTLADASLRLDTASVCNGHYTFMVGSDAATVSISLVNDSPYPAWFQSAQWEGLYSAKVRM